MDTAKDSSHLQHRPSLHFGPQTLISSRARSRSRPWSCTRICTRPRSQSRSGSRSKNGSKPVIKETQTPRPAHAARPRRKAVQLTLTQAILSLLSASTAVAAECVSLKGSTTCSAFQAASVSTNTASTGFYSFLGYVSDVASFDQQLRLWISQGHVQEMFQERFGCQNVNLSQTSELYARFSMTVACNGMIQNSITDCGLSNTQAPPVCAETCAEYAEALVLITSDSDLCSHPNSDLGSLIRAEFTTCALPVESLSSSSCIAGASNEPDNCGFDQNTFGLCSYCASGGINSTNTCCYGSNSQQKCQGVKLPTLYPTTSFTTPTSSPSAATSATSLPVQGGNMSSSSSGLGGGAIAGIVIGGVVALLLFALLCFCGLRWRRRRHEGSQVGSIFNQPSPARAGPHMSQSPMTAPQGYEVLPGGRIARMSALEGHSGDSPSRHGSSAATPATATNIGVGTAAATTIAAAASGNIPGRRRAHDQSFSDGLGESPESDGRTRVIRANPPSAGRRTGSQSSHSLQDPNSPISAGAMSSPQDVGSQVSQQLPFFRDYYSLDDIRPGDPVAVLWAYQPRAADEFALERGDMLKVVGIWDDGWATGVLLDERADEWDARRQAQRDSGVSNTSGPRDSSPPAGGGEIKAFPLVCVCIPEHWLKTLEGEGSTETGSSGRPAAPSAVS